MIKAVWDNSIGYATFVKDQLTKYLQEEDGIGTSVIILLFTDGRAPDGADIRGSVRGWWGNDFEDDPNLHLGSQIWVHIERGVMTNAVLEQARRAAQDALAPLVSLGVAKSATVEVERLGPDSLSIAPLIVRPDGSRWSERWEATLRALE